MNKNWIIIILALLLVGLGATWATVEWLDEDDEKTITINSFDDCVAAGYPVMESYPRQCNTPDGRNFVEEISPSEDGLFEYSSLNGVVVKVDLAPDTQVTSPLTVTGEVPGNWSFEASFPVVLTNWDGLIIAEHFATLQGDWMTEEYVPFSVELEFETPDVYNNGSLILRKDNPSGLPENDDAVEIPVTFNIAD